MRINVGKSLQEESRNATDDRERIDINNLPTEKEREEIIAIHIRSSGGNPDDVKLDIIASITDKWSGAEIESLIHAAKIDAYKEKREFNQKDILRNAGLMVPLSKTMEEQIRELTGWSFNRATPASKVKGRPIQSIPPEVEDPNVMKF